MRWLSGVQWTTIASYGAASAAENLAMGTKTFGDTLDMEILVRS